MKPVLSWKIVLPLLLVVFAIGISLGWNIRHKTDQVLWNSNARAIMINIKEQLCSLRERPNEKKGQIIDYLDELCEISLHDYDLENSESELSQFVEKQNLIIWGNKTDRGSLHSTYEKEQE